MSAAKRQQVLATLEADLLADHRAMPALLEHLEALHAALGRHDQGQVDTLNGYIQQAVDAMAERAQRRARVLRANRLAEGRGGMARLLACYPAERANALRMVWGELGEMLQQCRRLNERNGRLLAAQCELMDRWLEPSLYTPA